MDWSFMANKRIVRLNARLFPVADFERAQWARFNMRPLEVEAATPAEIIPHVAAGSVESGQDVSRGGVQNVAAILAGHWPLGENVVNAGVTPHSPLRPFDPALYA